jgi:HNH endonuclease
MKCNLCDKKAISLTPIVCCSMHYMRWYRHKTFEDPYHKPHLSKTGYLRITILKPGEKRGERILLHRHLMQEHLKRKLTKDEIVHHIDGNKLNNDIKNLLVISQSEHVKKYDAGRKKLIDWSKYDIPKNSKKKYCLIKKCPLKKIKRGLCSKHHLSFWRNVMKK